MELSHHVKKIGHSLVEIRVRALKSIISKLDHSLVSVSDLVQERRLFVVLLEWFNFPTVPMQDEALELLNTLSQHPGAAQMLRDVGAVEFLTQLSPNMEPRLRGVIDGILDQLFLLPELIPRHTTVYSHGQHIAAPTAPPVAPPEEHSIKMGFFQKTKQSNADVLPQRIAVSESVRCLKFSMFPWLALTTTDRHILSSNESSLRSNNPNLVQTTCELLRDVIMQDFPAEIFLQRPGIVQNLLSLLRLSSGEGEKRCLRLQALACLRQLCVCLRSRLRFHQDPSFRSSKQDPVSQNSSLSYSQEGQGAQRSLASSPGAECSPRPSVVGRTGQRASGDGQDGDAPSNSGSSHGGSGAAAQDARRPLQSPAPDGGAHLELPDLGAEDALELQLRQLSLAQFTLATMEHAIPLLKTEGTRVVHRVLDLLCKAVLLLGDCVNELVWDDQSLVGKELKEKLQVCLELLGDILSYHQRGSSDCPPQSAVVHHRLAYAGSAVFTVRLLQTIVPPEKASDNIPDGMAKAIFYLSLDPALGTAYPSVQESAVAYLEQVNPDGHDLYRRVTRASLWMESTCSFVKETQAQGEKNWLELLELADQAVDGLPYHQHLPIVKECVHLCSYLWKLDQPSSLLRTESQRVFLKLLSHPLLPVKTETYTCTLNLVKECLGIQNACRLASSVCCGVHFLLHHRVLYEISAFGLQDSADKVNAAAKDVLLFLIKGRLMMTASTWDRFKEAVYPVIPVLQGYAGTEDSLGNCVLLLSEVSDVRGDDVFPITGKLRAALRLLFTKKPTVRIAAVQDILPHLTSGERANMARPVLNQAVLDSLPSLFCLKQTLDITLDTIKNSFLKVESVEKLFGILTSDTVDVSLRRSSAEQLAVVLQDTAMHPVLKNLGITDKVIFFILESINGSESLDCLLEPCLCILRKLVYADPSLRHSLAENTPLLLMLLRASLLLKENKVNVSEAAALMCFLLFDEIATVDVWTDTSCSDVAVAPFSLPLSIVQRYNFPFQAAAHHAVSPYCCVLPPSSDLLNLAPARHVLQVAWNTAWHSGIDSLLEERRGIHDHVTEFHDDLTLSETQLLSLRASHRPTGLQDCIQAIATAAGHCSVTSALSRIRLYLLTDRAALLPHSHAPHSCRSVLRSLTWQRAFTRFLEVRPACLEDERLLADIVAFLNAYFQQGCTDPSSDQATDDLRWILELLLNHETASLLDLLLGVESQAGPGQSPMEPEELRSQVGQRLQRELTSFFNTLLRCLERTTDRLSLALAGPFRSQLAARLLQCLRVSDAPRFYGLPSLERTLLGMVSLTARPGWSLHCPELDSTALCSKYLSGLLEVISSFYVEWGGNAMSFMGKGVTKNAVICLLHLSHEMKAENKDNDFISQWALGQEAGSEETSASPMGLAWLIPLWVDRDAEVRFSSLGVASALSSVPSGCQGLSASCQNISGGLWGTLLNMLLDQQECSMVRREAAFILQNLLVMPMPASAEEAKDSHWQNPCVHDEVSGVSLVGLPALQALLYHCQYFQHVALSASACYLGRYIFHHLQPPASATRGPSPQESTSGDSENSLRYWTSAPPATAVNTSRASSSLSTSSTVLGGSGPHTPVALSPLGNVGTQDTPASRLMTQGQSDTDTSDSVISQDSRRGEPSAAEPVVVVTHDLLAAHCGLLSNLMLVLPDFTLDAVRHSGLLHSLASLVDAGPIEKCLAELKNPNTSTGEREDIKIQVFTLLQYTSSFSKFLQTCVTATQEFIGQMEFLKPLLANGVTVLTMDTDNLDAEAQAAVCMCWADVFTLLATLVRRDCSAAYPSVSAALGRRWQAFAGTLSVCVSERLGDPHLHTVALQFLCVLFFKETKRHIVEVTGLTSEPVTPLSDILNGPPAGHLCELLLQSFERRSSQDPLKRLTARAMMAVLACSRPAQTHAARAGLIDSCVEQMKQSQCHLYRESIRPGKAAHRKKEESYLKEVKLMAEILRNALYRNDDCKVAATDARLTQVLHALWPWLLLDDPTMEAVLELLCVYTANCTADLITAERDKYLPPELPPAPPNINVPHIFILSGEVHRACSSLCCGGGTGVAPGCRGPPSSTLMHCVMKLTSGLAADNSPVQKLAFSLLANLAMSRDCRGLLQKSNFLQAFLMVSIPKAGGVKSAPAAHGGSGGGGVLGLWLRLLVSLSFGEDGQQSILKVTGALELLVDLAPHRRPALLTLHNLCFCPANKTHVLANDKARSVLVSCLESKETEVRSMGASALWALLHNNQKAKTTLKSPSVRSRLEEAHVLTKKEAETRQDSMNAYLLKCLENLSQLLNN